MRIEELQRFISPLKNRILQLVLRAIVNRIDDTKDLQTLQVITLADEVQDDVEYVQPYGLASHAPENSQAVLIFPQGNRSHGVALVVGNAQYRLKGLASGEVALYHKDGNEIRLGADKITIKGDVEITGELKATGKISSGEDVETGTISLKIHTHKYNPGPGAPTDSLPPTM